MVDYLHGAYGDIQAAGTKAAVESMSAIVYIGTAPVHTLPGGAANVNKPMIVKNMADARRRFGYSDDWAAYTLCEAMFAHFEIGAAGPLVLINVLDPAKHKADEGGSVSMKPVNGRITIANAGDIILDSVKIEDKEKGTEYTVSYDHTKARITISEAETGALGDEALTVTYDKVDPKKVAEDDLIGADDGDGLYTGLHALRNVYQLTGCIPAHLLAPGFSCKPAVHTAMIQAAKKISGHWDAYVRADIPLTAEDGNKVKLSDAKTWKAAHGYNQPGETVYFPMAKGIDGRKYHISVLAAAGLMQLLAENDGIPYMTPSNTECAIISNLWFGDDSDARLFDDELVNEHLNKYGIASAAYVGGRWVIWGCHSADYTYSEGDQISVSETNRMMLYYVSNDFQHRRNNDVDKPMTANDIRSIVSEEQARLDALLRIGALTYGTVAFNASEDERSDIMMGDFSFAFNVTATQLAKSLTAVVNWTDKGYQTYYENFVTGGEI